MLTVVLNILSVIGLILLILLAIILSVILLILFVPICYKIRGQKQEQIEASVKANWLLGFIRLRFLYPEPGRILVKVLFFTVYDSEKEAKTKPIKKRKKKSKTNNSAKTSDNVETISETAPAESSTGEEQKTPTEPKETSQSESVQAQQSSNTDKDIDSKEKTSIKDKLQMFKNKIQDLWKTIKDVKENITYYKNLLQEEDTKQLFKHVLKRVGRVLKSIRPRKLKVNLLYGTGSPDTTGYIYAIYGMLCSYLGKHVIVEPDFNQAILKGDVYAAGHITIAKILWHALMLAIDKKLWDFISKVKREN